MSSNSLLPNISANRAIFNRAQINNLKVNNLQDATPYDSELVLLTLDIKNANVFENRIDFTSDNLTLVQWSLRTLDPKIKYNYNLKSIGEEALIILLAAFSPTVQGIRSLSINPGNAHLIINMNDHYIIVERLTIVNGIISLYFTSQENSPPIIPEEYVHIKMDIDEVNSIKKYNNKQINVNDTYYGVGNNLTHTYDSTVIADDFQLVFVETINKTFKIEPQDSKDRTKAKIQDKGLVQNEENIKWY